ncbi:MAG: outer membrane protein [Rhodothermaceae bacterium]|nr:MAG: outer membrane protein [Rhodothermaceae bacterium]
MLVRLSCFLLLIVGWMPGRPVQAQDLPGGDAMGPLSAYERPQPLVITDLVVEGVEEPTASFVRRASGLRLGQTVEVPGDPAIAAAVRALYRLGLFEDVKVLEAERAGGGVRLILNVRPVPILSAFAIEGGRERDRRALERELPLFPGSPVRPADLARAEDLIRRHFLGRGYPLVAVQTRREATAEGVEVTFVVTPGPQVEVASVTIDGNRGLSDEALRDVMQTRPRGSWRFWRKATFDPEVYRDDLERLVARYHEAGYLDARIVRDTTYLRTVEGKPERVIEIEVEEGPRYVVRSLAWQGQKTFSAETLTEALGLRPGAAYDGRALEEGLYGRPDGTDVTRRYLDRGHLRVQVRPTLVRLPGDSLDVILQVEEGPVYRLGAVEVAGNRTVREHVIRRELATIPGDTLSRRAIQASVLGLMRLGYFRPEALAAGPELAVDEAHQTVNLRYRVEEDPRNPLRLGGSYNGDLILQAGLELDNFSLRDLFHPSTWRPLPVGDGQRLALGVQATGLDYQQVELSFTEPWLGGRPHPFGVTFSYARIADGFRSNTGGEGDLRTWGLRLWHDRRLRPGLTLSLGLRYRAFDNRDWTTTLPGGHSQELVLGPALTWDTTDDPVLPHRGSRVRFGVELALPLDEVQYHKWRFQAGRQVSLGRHVGLNVMAEMGFTGSLTGEPVDDRLFLAGGSPFDAGGFDTFFGEDLVYMRGYPVRALGPRDARGLPVGGQLMNRYAAEVQWYALERPSFALRPYLFLEAANVWAGFSSYRPGDLFRSVGVGLRMKVPVLGVVDLSLGYNLDEFPGLEEETGASGWRLQISLGRTFSF